ncbi:MAG TPA: hypothetical protein VIJ42_15870 [Stellaceae bacterium]
MADARLPSGFSDLDGFADWALPTEAARAQRRRDSTLDDIRKFYDAMLPRLMATLDYLNGFPLDRMPEPERRLFDLSLAFAEIAPFVEQYGRTILPENFDERRFVPVRDNPTTGAR